jgi:uncharacterized delta-60 repeat protein
MDTSFDGDGVVLGVFTDPVTSGEAQDLAVQPDGKIVAVGRFLGDFAVGRFNSDGSLDTSFDGDGTVTTYLGAVSDEAHSVALQSDGKIVAAGESGVEMALARYHPDGSLDTSFGTGGLVVTEIGAPNGQINGVAVQPDGKIVAAGGTDATTHGASDFAILRFNPDGSLDTTFGGDGIVITDVGGGEMFKALRLQSDGKMVAAGMAGGDFGVARYNSDGSLDASFSGDGVATADFGHYADYAQALALQTDGKIVAAGQFPTSDMYSTNDFALARFNPDGSLDTTFDGDGKVTTNSAFDRAMGVLVQPDGKIVTAGWAFDGSTGDFALARYLGEGDSAPVAVDDGPFPISEGGTATGNVLLNDTDADGDPLTAERTSDPAHGNATLKPDGSFTYVHDGSETASDSFTYTANDGALDSNTGTVSITITGANDPPIATDDGPYEVDEGGSLAVSGLLSNDVDHDGDSLSATKVSDAVNGTVTLNPDGSFSYVHNGSETTSDRFTYRAWDETTGSNEAAVSITIRPVNDPPVAVDDGPYSVDQGGTLTVNGVLDNDTDVDSATLSAVNVIGPAYGTVFVAADGSFRYIHDGSDTTADTFTYRATDGIADSNVATVTIAVGGAAAPVSVGLVDPSTGRWHLRNPAGAVTSFFYGNPGDVPFVGDWDGDGTATPGLFRTSDAFAYLRNSNTQGIADVRFFFGNPSDIPLSGDWDGDGKDTLSIYRPSEQRFYIINKLGENEGGLGAADYSFLFGNPGDKPVVGDWDGDGIDEVGLHRESTGFFYWRNTLDTGIADGEIFFGDPGDRFVAGDWGVVDGKDTPAVFRPSDLTFYFRHTLTQGVADSQFTWTGADTTWLPVAGRSPGG